ncbi:MAG: omega-3 fatty acid desaturase [Acidobacteria bacterium]|nr:omega-3 fatty acid desaturase [Acidobacteriota bacterium]
MKEHHYSRETVSLRAELGRTLDRSRLRALHRRSAARHLLVGARQFLLLAVCGWALVAFEHPLVWVPLAIAQGFTVFNFTVLLHEVVHQNVFGRRRPRAERLLAWLYAVPSGISASQFTRWHLDHHAELGSEEGDPKRHFLSPTINARWFKLLYCTPALFPIYFRAARLAAAGYEEELRRSIARERRVAIAAHLSVLAALWAWGGAAVALRAYVVPVFFVFPVAFTLNRLGQHYDIDPDDPAGWTTLVRGHRFWNAVFLNSNFHLEHHYFPGVPFYRLPALQRELTPFYERRGLRWRGYGSLVRGWLVENRAPHTRWGGPAPSLPASQSAGSPR